MAEPAANHDDFDDDAPNAPVVGRTWPGGTKPPLDALMTTHPVTGERGIFIFAYGSICANPPPGQTERHASAIHGFRRDFSLNDIYYRGTEKSPGLTLGLEPHKGSRLPGIVYFAPEATAARMLNEVHAQETPECMQCLYRRQIVQAEIGDGIKVPALTFLANPESKYYIGQSLDMKQKANLIACSYGTPNNDYAKRHRPKGLIGKTGLEYVAMTALRLEDAGRPDEYLNDMTEMAIEAREAMIASGDREKVLHAHQLARMEMGTRVEDEFKDRIGYDVTAAAVAALGPPPVIQPSLMDEILQSGLNTDLSEVSTEGMVTINADKIGKWRDLRVTITYSEMTFGRPVGSDDNCAPKPAAKPAP